jgi:hypothetical protein
MIPHFENIRKTAEQNKERVTGQKVPNTNKLLNSKIGNVLSVEITYSTESQSKPII